MSSKLRNVDAIKQMLSGTHRTQTRKVFGFSDAQAAAERNKKRAIGERWIDENGDEWEQTSAGYRTKNPSSGDTLLEFRKLTEIPHLCPECNEPMTKRLDTKMYWIHKKCFDCVIKMETKMRLDGTYAEYAKNRIHANVLAWLKDTDVEVAALKEAIKQQPSYVNSDGSIEKWTAPNRKKLLKRIDADYAKFKQELLKEFTDEHEHVITDNP